jgi:hypothetical protein
MNEAKVPLENGRPVETTEEKQVRRLDEAEQFGLEPTHSDDVVLGAEIGGVGGAVTGALAGAALGIPGAITGAVIGGVLGAAGSAAAVAVVDRVDDDDRPEEVDLDSIQFSGPGTYNPPLPGEVQLHPNHPIIPRAETPDMPPPQPVEVDPTLREKGDETFPDSLSSDAMQNVRHRQTR